MASVSYWFLSPTVILAILGKLKGFDRTRPTPAFDWRAAAVDVVIPAKNEEATIALCLTSLFDQDFPVRKVTVIDDGSTDRTAEVVRRFCRFTGRTVELVVRQQSIGKTPSLREQCRASDADALLVLDADTVLGHPNYVSRLVEELFKNAGVASACGEVMPLTRRRRLELTEASDAARAITQEFGIRPAGHRNRFLEGITVLYRSALYLFLQRFLYDGHLKMFGSRLNPTGCAVAYKTDRLRQCFDYAEPRMGDDLSNSEDVFIGHFFSWKGYRNVQVSGVRCESMEPEITRLPSQLYFWSSSFLQAQYYFKELPLSLFKEITGGLGRLVGLGPRKPPAHDNRRRIREQYRAPWGEQHTRRFGRPLGWLDLFSMLEKTAYPLVMLYLAVFNREAALITIGLEAALSTMTVFVIADPGTRFRSAGMTLASTPVRLMTLGVDLVSVLKYLLDMATGNRKWRK